MRYTPSEFGFIDSMTNVHLTFDLFTSFSSRLDELRQRRCHRLAHRFVGKDFATFSHRRLYPMRMRYGEIIMARPVNLGNGLGSRRPQASHQTVAVELHLNIIKELDY